MVAPLRVWFNDKRYAGAGPLSDGIPEPVGDAGDSEKRMPPPLGTRCRLLHDTIPMRKVSK